MADGWEVTRQTEGSIYEPGAGFEPSWRITYRTDKGITGTIEVPKRMYGPETVRRLIDAEVAALHQVHEL